MFFPIIIVESHLEFGVVNRLKTLMYRLGIGTEFGVITWRFVRRAGGNLKLHPQLPLAFWS
jgi:hypothetical protein